MVVFRDADDMLVGFTNFILVLLGLKMIGII